MRAKKPSPNPQPGGGFPAAGKTAEPGPASGPASADTLKPGIPSGKRPPRHVKLASPGEGRSPTGDPQQAARHVPSSLSASPTNTRPENGFARYPAAPASPACRAPT